MDDEQRWYKVHYQIATYSGTIDVRASVDAEHDHIVACAKAELRRRGGGAALPFGAEWFRIERQEVPDGEVQDGE